MEYKVYCDNKLIAEFKHEGDRDYYLKDCIKRHSDNYTFTTEDD